NFGTKIVENKRKDLDLGLAYSATLELGVKWALGVRTSLYTGVYADYAFNDVADCHDDKFLDYSHSSDVFFCSVPSSAVTSECTTNGTTSSLVDKVVPAAFGLKLRLGINPCKIPSAPVVADNSPVTEDSDGDGVPDEKDACPGTPQGTAVDAKGCPIDSDGDGVADSKDKCPGTSVHAHGLVDEFGCPKDTDGDGVYDYKDTCPGTPHGFAVDAKGCPIDSDSDGVADSRDKCPGTSIKAHGFVDEFGCPKDTDGDGIFDYEDKCITVSGVRENFGCPAVKEAEKKVFEQAMRGIVFETGKDVIQANSYPVLDNIVKIMNDNPSYKLIINGHTDNVGNPVTNQELSERRALSVKNYLIGKGIAPARLTSQGFGDTHPLYPNTTVENKALNRRVEFIVTFEQ
ncbi:MAG: OmpA family protein, partial [Bacteroidales bacterium]|nr:OmpA family protein [Bacteroidales bacterium]